MNNKEIEEIMRMRDLANPHRRLIEEMNRMRDSLSPYNHYSEQLKALQNSLLDNIPRNNFAEKFHREFLDSKRALQQLDELREFNKQRRSLFDNLGVNTHLKAIEELKNNNLFKQDELLNKAYPKHFFDALQDAKANYLSLWQNQTAFALSLKQNEIEKLLNQTTSAIKAAAGLPNNFYNRDYWDTLKSIRGSFVGELTSSMRSVILDAQDDEEIIEKIESLVEEKLISLPENDFSRGVLWQIVIGILSLLLAIYGSGLATYQFIDSQKSSEEQKANAEKIIQLLQKIAENNSSDVEEIGSIYYVVERPINVKTHPKFKAMTIGFLSPGTKVRLLEQKHKWIFVEYIDYLEVVPRYGWVSKKYLTRIETTKSGYKQKVKIDESDAWSDEDLNDFRNASSNYANELLEDEDEW